MLVCTLAHKSMTNVAWQEKCSYGANGLVTQPVCSKRGVLMQRHIISTLTAFALSGIVVSGQQQPAPAQPEKAQAPKETITGCVVEARTTDGGTAYVLNNAEGGSAQMYVLAGSSGSDFAANVNKKVEV